MSPTLESLDSSLSSTETFVRWVALFAATFTALAAAGGVRLWLLQRAARPLREVARRANEERISTLQSKIAEANARAAEAKETAEAERLARVKIEEKLAPRRLSPEQHSALAAKMSALAKLPGAEKRQSVAVFSSGSSFEAAALADQIASALQAAGWDINRYPVMFGMSFSVSGVGILTSSNPRGLVVAGELAKALNDERVFAFLIPEKRGGCEEMGKSPQEAEVDPWCSQISVLIGDHP